MQKLSLTSVQTSLVTLLACTTLGALAGCKETVDSDAIRTKGIYANYEAVAGTKSTRVYAELRVGGDDGTYVHLVTGDQLTATFDQTSDNLSKDNDGYSHTFSGNAGGTEININFKRGEDKPAPDSNAVLPPEFTPLLAATSVPRNKAIVVDLGTGDEESVVEWKADGDCIFLASGRSADTGKLTIAASEIDATSSGEDDECSVTLTIDRLLKGSVDSAFGEGGQFRAIQRRSVAFTSIPVQTATPTTDAGVATTATSAASSAVSGADAGATAVNSTTTATTQTAPSSSTPQVVVDAGVSVDAGS